MPAVGGWLASVGIEIAGVSISGTTLAQAAFVIGSAAHAQHQQRKAAAAARAAFNASLKDRVQTVRGTLLPRQLIMGRVRAGGAVVFVGVSGANSEKLTLVIALASHACDGIEGVYFNDALVTLDGSGYAVSAPYYKTRTEDAATTMTVTAGAGSVVLPVVPVSAQVTLDLGGDLGSETIAGSIAGTTVSVTGWGGYNGTASVRYTYTAVTPMARVRWMLGADDQAAFADLITAFPAQWTANHRLRGITYLVAELTYDPDVYPGGIPNISALVRGAQVYDPRTTGTAWSDNPALLARWYALHPFGGRRTAAQIDDPSLIAAANICDTVVDYGAGNVALYQAGTVASTETTPSAVLDELVDAMAGQWAYSTGKLRVRAGAIGATVATLTADWLVGPVSVQPRPPRADLANVVQGSLADAAADYRLVPFARVVDAPAVAEDGAELVREVEYAAITRGQQAQQVATVQLREARQALTVTLECNLRAYSLQVFDVVAVTLDRFGWAAKLFEVRERSYTHGGAVRLTLRETAAASYAFGGGFPATDPAPNTTLPSAFAVPAIAGLGASSSVEAGGTLARIVATWTAPTAANVAAGGYVEVSIAKAAATAAPTVHRASALGGHTFTALARGQHYILRARAVTALQVRGDWCAPVVVQSAGDEAGSTFVIAFEDATGVCYSNIG